MVAPVSHTNLPKHPGGHHVNFIQHQQAPFTAGQQAHHLQDKHRHKGSAVRKQQTTCMHGPCMLTKLMKALAPLAHAGSLCWHICPVLAHMPRLAGCVLTCTSLRGLSAGEDGGNHVRTSSPYALRLPL